MFFSFVSQASANVNFLANKYDRHHTSWIWVERLMVKEDQTWIFFVVFKKVMKNITLMVKTC